MATPTPFASLSGAYANTMQMQAPLPGTMAPFWGNPSTSQSITASQAKKLENQLAMSPASPALVASTRQTMDLVAQFLLGLAILVTMLNGA